MADKMEVSAEMWCQKFKDNLLLRWKEDSKVWGASLKKLDGLAALWASREIEAMSSEEQGKPPGQASGGAPQEVPASIAAGSAPTDCKGGVEKQPIKLKVGMTMLISSGVNKEMYV